LKKLIDILEFGCYAFKFYDQFDGLAIDCVSALRFPPSVVLLLTNDKIVVVHVDTDKHALEIYDSVEEAVEKIMKRYGDVVVRKLLREALNPKYSFKQLEAKLKEIFEEK
jgi:hypothetical protein